MKSVFLMREQMELKISICETAEPFQFSRHHDDIPEGLVTRRFHRPMANILGHLHVFGPEYG
jgi:hypothetical protein